MAQRHNVFRRFVARVRVRRLAEWRRICHGVRVRNNLLLIRGSPEEVFPGECVALVMEWSEEAEGMLMRLFGGGLKHH